MKLLLSRIKLLKLFARFLYLIEFLLQDPLLSFDFMDLTIDVLFDFLLFLHHFVQWLFLSLRGKQSYPIQHLAFGFIEFVLFPFDDFLSFVKLTLILLYFFVNFIDVATHFKLILEFAFIDNVAQYFQYETLQSYILKYLFICFLLKILVLVDEKRNHLSLKFIAFLLA